MQASTRRMRRRAAAAQHSTARPSQSITAQPGPAAFLSLRCCAQRRCHFSEQQHTAGPASEHASGATKPKMAMACTAGGCGCSGAEHSVGTAASACSRGQQQPQYACSALHLEASLYEGQHQRQAKAPGALHKACAGVQQVAACGAWEDRPVSTDGILSGRSRSQTGAAGVPARTHMQQAPQSLAKQQ